MSPLPPNPSALPRAMRTLVVTNLARVDSGRIVNRPGDWGPRATYADTCGRPVSAVDAAALDLLYLWGLITTGYRPPSHSSRRPMRLTAAGKRWFVDAGPVPALVLDEPNIP